MVVVWRFESRRDNQYINAYNVRRQMKKKKKKGKCGKGSQEVIFLRTDRETSKAKREEGRRATSTPTPFFSSTYLCKSTGVHHFYESIHHSIPRVWNGKKIVHHLLRKAKKKKKNERALSLSLSLSTSSSSLFLFSGPLHLSQNGY